MKKLVLITTLFAISDKGRSREIIEGILNLIFNLLFGILWFFFFTFFQGFQQLSAQTTIANYKGVYYYVGNPPDVFMNETNTDIISHLRNLNCNTVFMYFKTSVEEPDNNNLGLYVYPPNANFPPYYGKYCYRDKLIDFIHTASSLQVPIKVFALQLETDKFIEIGWTKAEARLKRIAYYQCHVREIFPNKLALLNGVVTNIEPWTIESSNPVYLNGTPYYWKSSFCTAANRTNNNSIMNHYLEFAQFIKSKLFQYNYYQPYNPYTVDNIILGTTHWYLHYFSQRYHDDFPFGDFGLLASPGRFDIIIPQTYCSQYDLDCQNVPCINPNLYSFCSGNYSDEDDYSDADVIYDESTGKCITWFEKHLLTNFMYTGFTNYTIPFDAAPMLMGHSAWMFSTFSLLNSFRDHLRYVSRICYSKINYKGSVIFNYHEAINLPAGIPVGIQPSCNPDNTISISERQIVIYPNPATSIIFFEGLTDDDRIIINGFLNDHTFESNSINQVNIGTLPEGWYLIQVIDKQGNRVYYNKVFIKH
ncbi:MAG: hypothetical protein STSR0006_14520 [Lentimicrobium sp.]